MSFAESQNLHEDQRLKCIFKIHVPCFRKRLFETNNSRRDIFHDIAFLINLHSWVLSLSNIENHCPNQETQFCPIVYKTWNRSTPVKRLFTIFRCGPRSDYSTPLSETYSTTTSGNIISYYQLLNTVVYTGNATRLISMFIQYLKLILMLMPALVMVVLVLSLMLSCQFWGHHHTI